jgi:hypothetical protein
MNVSQLGDPHFFRAREKNLVFQNPAVVCRADREYLLLYCSQGGIVFSASLR